MRLNDHYPSVTRMILGGNALVSWYNAMTDPMSALWAIGRQQYGSTLMWLMGLFGAMIVIDVILNDWTPKALCIGKKSFIIRWRRAFKYRHWIFVGLAVCYAGQPYVAEMSGNRASLIPYFYWIALTNIAVAFMDAAERSRSQRWQKAYS